MAYDPRNNVMRPSIRQMVAAFRALKTDPDVRFRTGLWTDPEWNGAQFRRWFHSCLENKVNSKDPRFPKGRKAGEAYQIALMRMRQYVGNRIVIDWIDPILGPRVRQAFAHRLRNPDDYR
jgi:hypothetical protein